MGANHDCGLRAVNGEVVCWGDASGIAGWPKGVAFSQVSTGLDSTCGILRDSGELRCWGETQFTDLSSSGAEAYTQLAVDGGPDAFASRGLCAIRRADGTVQCWGVDKDVFPESPTLEAPSGVAFKSIIAGGCGNRRDDSQI